jgi:putative hydrolase of the HAD superfamily
MIKALILDFGGVLVTMPADAASAQRVADELGVPWSEVMPALLGGDDWQRAMVGEITAEEFDRRVHARYGLAYDPQRPGVLHRLFEDEVLSLDLLAFADDLRHRHALQVAVLSNASTDLEEAILRDKFGILDRFDLVINSSLVGLRKPDQAIYQLVLRCLGVAPDEVIFVDDIQGNVEAAADLGMHAIRFEGESQAIEAIQKRLERQ